MKRISQLETIAHTKHIAATLFWPTVVILDALGRDPTNVRRVFIAVRTVKLIVLRRHAPLYISFRLAMLSQNLASRMHRS